MRFRWTRKTFASQGRSAFGAESAPGSTGRGIELGYLAFGNGVRSAVEQDKSRNRRAGVPSTTLAMTPVHRLRLTGSDKTHCAAQAATFKLLSRAAHDAILQCLQLRFRAAALALIELFATPQLCAHRSRESR